MIARCGACMRVYAQFNLLSDNTPSPFSPTPCPCYILRYTQCTTVYFRFSGERSIPKWRSISVNERSSLFFRLRIFRQYDRQTMMVDTVIDGTNAHTRIKKKKKESNDLLVLIAYHVNVIIITVRCVRTKRFLPETEERK